MQATKRGITSMNASPSSPAQSQATEKMTVAELKAWLTSKGAPTKGKKSELVER